MHRGTIVAEHRPDEPFRIASMSKSFTSAAIGLLKPRGLDLDAPLASIVPEVRATAVADLTCRQALTMSTGFSKDDPWADRMESLSRRDFLDILHGDLTPIAPAGTGFEYSNINFALLGLVAEAVGGRPFTELTTAEVIAPLGLTRTGFDHRDFPDLVPGLRVDRGGSAHPVEVTGPGAFSAIGGLISTVGDVCAWISAHLEALESRREGQTAASELHSVLAENQEPRRLIALHSSRLHAESIHYGFGLQHRLDSRFGRVICHSGGYPGYGSHMRWFPDIGLGVVVLANTSNHPAEAIVERAVDAAWLGAQGMEVSGADGPAIRRTTTPAPVPRFRAEPELSRRVLAAAQLVLAWDESFAEQHFAVNMDLDQPRAERLDHWRTWCESHGVDRCAQLTTDDLVMETRLLGAVSLPASPSAPAGEDTTTPTITVRLNHLGEVQAITLSP